MQALDHISIDRIQTAEVVDGSWCPVNQTLIDDIRDNPGRYAALFDNAANLRVLDYLAACNRLDATPYQSNYSLIHQIDADCFADYKEDTLELTDDQFRELVGRFQRRVEDRRQNAARPSLPTLGLNLISIDTRQGLYVLAYRPLRLDVKKRALRAEPEPVICREFTVNGSKLSIHQFLDADDYTLLDEFTKHAETIKDRITGKANGLKDQWANRKLYHYYRCPQCRQKLRVPRGRGRIQISCPRCGTQFIKKS